VSRAARAAAGSAPATVLRVAAVLADPASGRLDGPAEIRLENGRIAALTPLGNDLPEDASGVQPLIALPAPANAHDHGRGLRSAAFGAHDEALETWLAGLAREPLVDPWLRAVVAFGRMVEGGAGIANHCHNTQRGDRLLQEAQGVAKAAADVGLRIAFALPFAGRNAVVYGELDHLLRRVSPRDHEALRAMRAGGRSLAENLALMEQAAAFEHEGFQLQYCPVGPQWVDDATLAAIARGSADSGRRVHMHLLETRYQREWADAHYADGLIAHLDAIGLLSPRLTVAHAVWLTPAECELLAERGVIVAANASSNLRLRSGVAPVRTFRASGLRFGIGMDGMSLDDDDDLLREMRLLRQLNRGSASEPDFDAGTLFAAACVDGRRSVLGDDGGGRIAVGAPADLLLLDSRRFSRDCLAPGRDQWLALMLTRMRAEDIAALYIGGRAVAVGGRACGVDLPALEAELTALARAARALAPPDEGRIGRLRAGVEDYYKAGCHGH